MLTAFILGGLALLSTPFVRTRYKDAFVSLGALLVLSSFIFMFCSHFYWGLLYFVLGSMVFSALLGAFLTPKKNPLVEIEKTDEDFSDKEDEEYTPLEAPLKLLK